MKIYRYLIGPAAVALLGGYLMFPPAAPSKIGEVGGTAEINRLLGDAKAEAIELKKDATDMESFTRSDVTWEMFSDTAELMREHVNKAGKLLTKLENAKPEGALWQQKAIERISPLLHEMADNTSTTIQYLNENHNKVHFPEFRDYVKANLDVANSLEALIRNFVDYGNTKEKYERLGAELEID